MPAMEDEISKESVKIVNEIFVVYSTEETHNSAGQEEICAGSNKSVNDA